MARLSYALNSVFGSFLILVLIFADYICKYNTNPFQRGVFLRGLIFSLIALIAEGFRFAMEGYPGKVLRFLLYADLTVYFLFQAGAFFCTFVFIDYLSFQDNGRTKIIGLVQWAVFIIHGAVLALNLFRGFYFYISEDNIFYQGNLFFICVIISSIPAALIIGDLVKGRKNLKKSQVYMVILFLLTTGTGAAAGLILKRGSLVWPCYSAALLYIYFFIIGSDSKIDTLTGIENRYSFNEFIDSLGRQNSKKSYAVVMIDMDHFKQINDTLGHLEGDNALRDMAAIIKGSVRHSDFAARYGGDEFIVAIPAEYNMEKLIERIQQAMDLQNEKKVRPYKLEISYGYDVYTTNSGQSVEKFLSHIDSLMYKHKAERRKQNSA
jgi:diguanylate cyclase (GGDEF)-like protein